MFVLCVIAGAILSCSKDSAQNLSKTPVLFDSITRPYYEYNEAANNYLLEPWNYGHPANRLKEYPLVVYLHGMGGAGNISYLNYLGYDNPENQKYDSRALDFQKNYQSFVLVPQTSSSWDNKKLIEQIEGIKDSFRIDRSCVYLIGYSMGGSGSYSLANGYYDFNQHLFAGIIRLAGQSQTVVRDKIAEQSGIWLHIGLTDTQKRIDVTREAYNFLKEFHKNAKESNEPVPIEGYKGTTYILNVDSKDRFLRTEYEGVGHGVSSFPFKDERLMQWLFEQQLTTK